MIVQVIYPIAIDTKALGIKIDKKRLNDDDYVQELQNKIKDAADQVIQTSGIKPVIHRCEECKELVE